MMYHHDETGGSQEPPANSTPAATHRGRRLRCAYCGEKYEPSASPCKPFCSSRCQKIDLGNWLDESYGLPYEGEGTPEPRVDLSGE